MKNVLALLLLVSEVFITKFQYTGPAEAGQGLNLSLLLGPCTFMYATFTNGFGSVAEICHVQMTDTGLPSHNYADSVAFLVNNHGLQRKNFVKVNIAVLNREFTLIPEAYADKDIKSILDFTTGQLAGNCFNHYFNDMAFCFGLPPELSTYLEKTFAGASIRHAGAVNIGLLFGQHSLSNCNLLLTLHDSVVELAARHGSRLLYYNAFVYETNEDVLYYLLFMMEQLGFNPPNVHLGLAGEREVTDDLFTSIKKYIKHVDFCVHHPMIKLHGEATRLPSHNYFTLLNQHLCEL